MSDFHQTGVVATLHKLGSSDGSKIEKDLESFGRQRPIALVLPALYSEFESDAMHNIIRELSHVKFLHQIVLSLDRADANQFRQAREFLAVLATARPRDLERWTAFVGALRNAGGKRLAHRTSRQRPGMLDGVWLCFGKPAERHHCGA